MKFISNRYVIKIPSEISVFYFENKKKLLIVCNSKKIILDLKVKLKVLKSKNYIIVTNIPFKKISNNFKNKLKSLQGSTYFLIKKIFKNIDIKTCKKLKLVGVGYKVFEIAHANYKLLHFKLGYSHNIYYRIPDNIEIVVSQSTKIFISSYDYTLVSAVSSIIKNYKYPEPYKGKGILYFNESIKLKEGKKI